MSIFFSKGIEVSRGIGAWQACKVSWQPGPLQEGFAGYVGHHLNVVAVELGVLDTVIPRAGMFGERTHGQCHRVDPH